MAKMRRFESLASSCCGSDEGADLKRFPPSLSCAEKERRSCGKRHPCGHWCGGGRGEAKCLPCLHPEGRKLVELVNRVQAEPRADLFKMEIDVNFLRNEKILENKMRPWLESKIDLFMGGCQSDLVEFILRRVNGNSTPEALISDLSRYLDDHTDTLVERLWRMIGFELLVGGAAPSLLKKEK